MDLQLSRCLGPLLASPQQACSSTAQNVETVHMQQLKVKSMISSCLSIWYPSCFLGSKHSQVLQRMWKQCNVAYGDKAHGSPAVSGSLPALHSKHFQVLHEKQEQRTCCSGSCVHAFPAALAPVPLPAFSAASSFEHFTKSGNSVHAAHRSSVYACYYMYSWAFQPCSLYVSLAMLHALPVADSHFIVPTNLCIFR
eukprot:1156411-Pelagomonas_calceolata.AAC.5